MSVSVPKGKKIGNVWAVIGISVRPADTRRKDTCPDDQVCSGITMLILVTERHCLFNLTWHLIYRSLNSFHFARVQNYHPPKAWSAKCRRPSRREARDYDRPILVRNDMVYIFWKNLYELLWRRSTESFRVIPAMAPSAHFISSHYIAVVSSKAKLLWPPHTSI